MTKLELFELLKDVPDQSQIDIYDLDRFCHPEWRIDLEKYYDYDNGTPIVTIEIGGGEN